MDDLEVLLESSDEVVERDAEGGVLGLVPAAAQSQDQSPARQVVEGLAHLRHEPGIPERRAHHECAQLDPLDHAGQRGEGRPGLVQALVGLVGEAEQQVVEDPDRIEADTLGAVREVDRLGERRGPTILEVAVGQGNRDADAHRRSLSRRVE